MAESGWYPPSGWGSAEGWPSFLPSATALAVEGECAGLEGVCSAGRRVVSRRPICSRLSCGTVSRVLDSSTATAAPLKDSRLSASALCPVPFGRAGHGMPAWLPERYDTEKMENRNAVRNEAFARRVRLCGLRRKYEAAVDIGRRGATSGRIFEMPSALGEDVAASIVLCSCEEQSNKRGSARVRHSLSARML